MILSVHKTNTKKDRRNDICKLSKYRCKIKCDTCNKEYESTYNNRLKNWVVYSNDLCRSCKQSRQYKSGLREKQKEHCKKLAKSQIGLTFEDRFGIEKATKMKHILSNCNSGKNNNNFGAKYSHGYGSSYLSKYSTNAKGKTLEEIHGVEKATEMKKKQSIASSGKNNPMYGKPTPEGSGNGWSGWLDGIYFRSLLEVSYLYYLIDNDIKFESAEKSKHQIKYTVDGNDRTYSPDYYLVEENLYIEVKPESLVNNYLNNIKFEAAKEKLGNNFMIKTEKTISILSDKFIYSLYQNGRLKFIERYEQKYMERLQKGGIPL